MKIKIFYLFLLFLSLTFITNLSFNEFKSNSNSQVLSRSIAQVTENDLDKYEVFQGGPQDIPSGSLVEGSIDHGGIQPHYIIDFNSSEFDELKHFAKEIKANDQLTELEKIEALQIFIRNNVLKNRSYKETKYLSLLEKFRDRRESIPLSQYRICASGVCREHALIFHLALKEAGIENFHVYVKAYQGKNIEDHALNIVIYNGEEWVDLPPII